MILVENQSLSFRSVIAISISQSNNLERKPTPTKKKFCDPSSALNGWRMIIEHSKRKLKIW